jgi:uncharacterized repeat protein (TIGR03803 family)
LSVHRKWAPLSVAILGLALAAGLARAQTYEVLHTFNAEGGEPESRLIRGADGNLYGTALNGGAYGTGSIFVIKTQNPTQYAFSVLHSFLPLLGPTSPEGANPFAGLVQAANGAFYGTTTSGGDSGMGTVFRIDASGAFATLHSFSGPDGAHPRSDLIRTADGSFYGTTYDGGTAGNGTVFRMDASGAVTVMHSFAASDGANPYARLLQAADGNFYGTTFYGGLYGYGTVFRMQPSGTLAVLHSFTNTEGINPAAGLIQATDGNFYGTTYFGGENSVGTIYRINSSGVFATLHSFALSEGASPNAGLLQASDGDLYGATVGGGTGNAGTVFKITTSGSFAILHPFAGADGRSPAADLIQADDGDFFGTTVSGGVGDKGTVYRLQPSGAFAIVHSFADVDGAYPCCLIRASDGNFYGMTPYGGTGGYGTIFKMDAAGALSTIHSFTFTDGANPVADLLQGTDGKLYGTAVNGGAGVRGTIFRMALAGALDVLYSFDSGAGNTPHAGLIQAVDGKFYGTTAYGPPFSGYGTVYRITPAGVYDTLHTFTFDEGANPYSPVVQGADGNFYGTTLFGRKGSVFKMAPSGALTTLHFFTGADGDTPWAGLARGDDGYFYGTTAFGGANGYGTVFRINGAGDFATVHSFERFEGATSISKLIRSVDGHFYGMTPGGGANGFGTIYRVSVTGDVTVLHDFAYTDGAGGQATLIEAPDGTLYGAAAEGGAHSGGGVIFRLTGATCPPPVAGNNGPICEGETLLLTASAVPGASYNWTGPNGFISMQQNPQIPSAAASASGTYSVTVTVNNCVSPAATTNALVRPRPSAVISAFPTVCPSSSGNVASAPSAGAGATYDWSVINGTITSGAGTSSITFTAGPSGSVELGVTVTDGNGCAATGNASLRITTPCFSSGGLIPDGRAATSFLQPGGNFYEGAVLAGRSYCVETEVPFAGSGTLSGGGPSPVLSVTRADGTTAVSSQVTASCEPGVPSRLSFTPTDADVAGGPLQFQVSDPASSGYPFRMRLTETTMFCPRWSINGYTALVNLQNTSDCAVSGEVILLDSTGTALTMLPFSLDPGATTQFPVSIGLSVFFGSARLTHDGSPGALTGGISMVNNDASAANYRWPFREVRAYGATDGK